MRQKTQDFTLGAALPSKQSSARHFSFTVLDVA